jgi:glycosyltransferase involved in cell wall biosynthesis
MIYLDVTSACQSSLNTGVKRMQRGLYACLMHSGNCLPVCWQSARRGYRALQERDRENLLGSDAKSARGPGLFDNFAPGLISDWLHFADDHDHMLPAVTSQRDGDVLLVPDLLWDNRGPFLRNLSRSAAYRVGIFHDAIALRRPQQSRIDRYYCARGVSSLAGFDWVLCISREAESDLHFFWSRFGLKPAPTHVLPWPVPFTDPRPENSPNFSAKNLLYVARLEDHKNHLRLLDACEKLWREGLSFNLRLIGCMAYPDTAWRIWRRVRSLQAAGRPVRWQGQVSESELHSAYAESSFTVFPSLLEGFGLPIIESLWHGRPVVCGNNGALGEVAAGGGCEIVEPQSEESLAQGLRLLLNDERHYQDRCSEIQRRKFRTWEDYRNELSELLEPRIQAQARAR